MFFTIVLKTETRSKENDKVSSDFDIKTIRRKPVTTVTLVVSPTLNDTQKNQDAQNNNKDNKCNGANIKEDITKEDYKNNNYQKDLNSIKKIQIYKKTKSNNNDINGTNCSKNEDDTDNNHKSNIDMKIKNSGNDKNQRKQLIDNNTDEIQINKRNDNNHDNNHDAITGIQTDRNHKNGDINADTIVQGDNEYNAYNNHKNDDDASNEDIQKIQIYKNKQDIDPNKIIMNYE